MPLTGAMNSDAAFMSRETTASGEPLLCQLLLSHIIGFLIQCRRQLPGGGENSETDIRETLNAFFRDVDCEPPADMTLFVERAEPGEPGHFSHCLHPLPDSPARLPEVGIYFFMVATLRLKVTFAH